jgi:hypothetical protein
VCMLEGVVTCLFKLSLRYCHIKLEVSECGLWAVWCMLVHRRNVDSLFTFHHGLLHVFLPLIINVATFRAPCADAHHLTDLVGSGACIWVVGHLSEVYMVEYNQECVVVLYNGTAVKVIDGSVSEICCSCK